MKKLFLITVALFASISSFAQFGITGGLTSSATSLSAAYAELTTKTINQFHVGVTYKFSLGNVIAIQPALLYNVKGAKLSEISFGDISGTVDAKFKTGYLELPVQVQAGASLGKVVRLYGIAEPFLGYAVSNTVKGDDSGEFSASWDYITLLASRFHSSFEFMKSANCSSVEIFIMI